MKSELQSILNKINAFDQYSPEKFNDFRNLVKLCVEKLQTLSSEEPSPMLATWISMGLEELRKELNTRLSDQFISLSIDRQKTEFAYARSTVSMTLMNIIMHM
jgi:hypothetical protein